MRPTPVLALLTLPLAACSTPARVDPAAVVGATFPTVRGDGLDGKAWTLPADLAGKPALIFVGFKQNTQFDIDRWMLALTMLETPVDVYEVPTISGMIPGLFGNAIDGGMRQGIPREAWKTVITVYRDAGRIEAFTGAEPGLPARVLLLDREGRVLWFHDRGFLPGLAKELDAKVRSLPAAP